MSRGWAAGGTSATFVSVAVSVAVAVIVIVAVVAVRVAGAGAEAVAAGCVDVCAASGSCCACPCRLGCPSARRSPRTRLWAGCSAARGRCEMQEVPWHRGMAGSD